MKRILLLYWEYFKLNMIRISYNKWDSIIGAISWFVLQVCGLISAFAIIKEAAPINGWGVYEVGLLYAGMTFARAISMIFFDSFWSICGMVQFGEFDIRLLKPTSPFFQVLAHRIEPAGLGNLLFSLLTFFFCFSQLNITLTIPKILLLLLYLLCGTAILSELFFLINCLCFWVVSYGGLSGVILSLVDFIKFPISVLPKGFQIILTFILPLAFINYYPIGFVLDKFNNSWIGALPFIVGTVLFLISREVWKRALKNYNSTGS